MSKARTDRYPVALSAGAPPLQPAEEVREGPGYLLFRTASLSKADIHLSSACRLLSQAGTLHEIRLHYMQTGQEGEQHHAQLISTVQASPNRPHIPHR